MKSNWFPVVTVVANVVIVAVIVLVDEFIDQLTAVTLFPALQDKIALEAGKPIAVGN